MQALKIILGCGRAPYISFSLWGPWDEREQAKRRYAGWAQNGQNLWAQGPLPRPSDFAQWLLSWQVLRTAFIATEPYLPDALDSYAGFIKALDKEYPFKWGGRARRRNNVQQAMGRHSPRNRREVSSRDVQGGNGTQRGFGKW